MPWFGYVFILFLAAAVLLVVLGWRSHRRFKRVWQGEHLNELTMALLQLKWQQLAKLSLGESMPSSFTSALGYTVGYAIIPDDGQSGTETPDSETAEPGTRGAKTDDAKTPGNAANHEEDPSGGTPPGENSADGRVRHHLVVEAHGFFGRALAERVLAFCLQRFDFAPEHVQLYIMAYAYDSVHAFVEVTGQEYRAWVDAPLTPLSSDRTALEQVRDYWARLGEPGMLLKEAFKRARAR
ncbi:MAG: hypothetical protein AAGC55_33180 [Myxococcota bacterium]